jgi:deferrochelatase/peroxidase EfeB
VSRRGFLGGLGAVGAGAALAASGGLAACSDDKATHTSGGASGQVVPVNGAHQAGIATPAQDRVAFAALDVTSRDPHQLAQLLDQWTASARAMTQGSVVPGGMADQLAAPADTGEAYGLSPAKLTVTIGFGPSLFDHRFGLAARRPQALEELPPLPGDELDPAFVGGDLCIQACSDDPQVAFHAVRNLARQGTGTVVHRWMQLGFGRTSSTTSQQLTPRNLMGFKDGTRNISSDDTGLMDGHVWVGESDQPWLRGGSFVVARRIKMLLEIWDRNMLADQEATFGRAKLSGAPLTGHAERDVPDFAAKGADGDLVIPADARAPRQPRAQPRRADPAPRLLLHRRHRPRVRLAARRPLLPGLHEGPAAVRHAPAQPRAGRRAQRVHPPHRQCRVRLPAGHHGHVVLARPPVQLKLAAAGASGAVSSSCRGAPRPAPAPRPWWS